MNESHAKKTVVGLPGPAIRPTVPNGTPSPDGRMTTEADYRNERQSRAGTRMAGMDALQEPNASDKRVRLGAGRVVPGTRYRITRWLGEGGMGVVYEAEHIDIERKAALKILRFDLSQEERMTQVFRDEARTASRIGNENIVEIFDFGELPDGRLFFCMELVDGKDLVPASDDDWIEPSRLIGLLRQTCKGLHAAHRAGIVHRDVKPENVLIVEKDGRPDVVKIVDFGISAMLAAGQESGAIAGTPHYMAPEQIRGEAFDGRLDIYSLGCMAYELLVGWPPFLGDELEELLRQHLQDAPRRISEVRPERNIPPQLEAVILKCLEKNPANRYQDMADLEAALCEAQIAAKLTTPFDDLPLPDSPSITPERRERLIRDMPTPANAIVLPQQRKWLWPVVAGLSALAATAALIFALRGPKPTDEDQALVDQLTAEANQAGALTHYVYPPVDDAEAPTTFIKVKELENLEGSADELGDDRAEELRGTYAQTLVSLGDRYWGDDATRRVARDYYFQSLLFDPDNDTAFERAGNPSPGELAEWRDKAASGRFSPEELRNGILLNALATDDKDAAQQKLDTYVAMAADDDESLMREQSVLTAARGAGLKVAKRSKPTSNDGDGDGDGDELDADELGDGDGDGDEAGLDEAAGANGSDVPPPPKKGVKKRNKTDEENLAKAQRDPDKAAELADEGEAALAKGQRKNAESLFHQAVGYDRRNAKALMGLSDVYFDTGSNQKAVLYAERAVKAAPQNKSYRLKLGDAYYKVLRYRDALTQYEKAKELGASKADDRIAKVKPKVGG